MSDIFGKIFLDAFNGLDSTYKVIRDDGYVTEASGSQYVVDVLEWPEPERIVIKDVKGPVLDIGCGAGRVGTYLQKNGIDYWGIDVSPIAIDVCKQRGLEHVHLMSAEDLQFEGILFRSVIMFGNNFGILGDEDKTVRMMEGLHEITESNAYIYAASRDVRETDDPAHLAYHRKNRQMGRPIGKVTIKILYQGQEGEWFDLLMVAPEEMNRLAERAGWYLKRTIGSRNQFVGVLKKR